MKNIWSKIKAMFCVAGQSVTCELKRAEFKDGIAYLHPANDDRTYVIKHKDVDILINNGEDIEHKDFIVIENRKVAQKEFETEEMEQMSFGDATITIGDPNSSNDDEQLTAMQAATLNSPFFIAPSEGIEPYFLKRKMTITLYGDEMELMEAAIKTAGMRRADFIMACLHNSQKKSVIKTFSAECERVKKYRAKHNQDVKDFYSKTVEASTDVELPKSDGKSTSN